MDREEVMMMNVSLGKEVVSRGFKDVPKGTKGKVIKITGFSFRMLDQEKWPIEVEWENKVINTYPPNNREGLIYILEEIGIKISRIDSVKKSGAKVSFFK